MSGGQKEGSYARLVRSAGAGLALLISAAASRGDTKILGPLGPVESGRSLVGLALLGLACCLAALAAAGLCYLAMRRRCLPADGAACEVDAEDPFEGIDPGGGAAEFYAGLLGAVRGLLAQAAVPHAMWMTPRELRARALSASGAGLERLSGLCERAERAEYAGEDVAEELREQDLAWARRVLNRGLARGPEGDDEGGV